MAFPLSSCPVTRPGSGQPGPGRVAPGSVLVLCQNGRRALLSIEEPLRQIVANAGEDAATGTYGDMLETGILDPTKVTRLALQNAASVAGLLLTTEVMVAESPKDEDHKHGGMPDMGDMGGMGM